MTDYNHFPEGKVFYAVFKTFIDSDGEMTCFFNRYTSLKDLHLFRLVSTGERVDELTEDSKTILIDHLGNTWWGSFNSSGIRLYPVGSSLTEYEFVFPDDMPDEVRERMHQFDPIREIRKDYAGIVHQQMLDGLIRRFHLGELTWDDISAFVPGFCGMTEDSVAINKAGFMDSYDNASALLEELASKIREQVERFEGRPFDEVFAYGPVTFTIKTPRGLDDIARVDALSSHSTLTYFKDDSFGNAKLYNAIYSAYIDAVGGGEMLYSSYKQLPRSCVMLASDRNPEMRVAVEYAEYPREGVKPRKVVLLKSDDLDLPLAITIDS